MDADIALDITQEAFLRLWKQWQAAEEIQNPRAWLMRVARNLAEDYVKSAFRRNGTHPPQLMNGVRAPEWSPLESGAVEFKVYAPGVGVVYIEEHHGKTVITELVAIE